MLLYCCADLLWATKIKSTAEALGLAARPVRNLDMLTARLADSPVKALMVDLEAGPVSIELITHVRAHATAAIAAMPIVAFGPHVNVEGLMGAKAAGASAVMARGALNANLPDILRSLDRGAAVGSKMED
jgi:hypothetical protein